MRVVKNFGIEELDKLNPSPKNLINTRNGFPTFKNVSINQQMNSGVMI